MSDKITGNKVGAPSVKLTGSLGLKNVNEIVETGDSAAQAKASAKAAKESEIISSKNAVTATASAATATEKAATATEKAATATEKAAEAKASADIASDSLNFKTETILIPKWESPDVNFVQATKTFVFKLQDVSIYKLTPALWDMSTRELVSFTRSTKAWWNGVEYGINVPRIKDDKLLIEAQATNLLRRSEHEYTAEDITNNPNGAVSAPEVANSTATFIMTATSKAKFIIRFGNTTSVGGVEQLIELEPNIEQIVSLSVGVYSGGLYIYPYDFRIADAIIPQHLNIKMQIEAGAIATSYIPTSGTPVTRAADIATVRDKA